MNHPTTKITTDSLERDVTALVLVGPPAAGKSTIRKILTDYGVETCDVTDSHEYGRIVDDGWKRTILRACNRAMQSPPSVVCIEGPIDETQIEFIDSNAIAYCVIRVEAEEPDTRVDRYIDREVSSGSTVSSKDIEQKKNDIDILETSESPYPDHDLLFDNSDDLSATDFSKRCVNIISTVSGLPRSEFAMPETVENK